MQFFNSIRQLITSAASCAVLAIALASSASAQTSTGTFNCPDDGSVDVASNVAGTKDKVLVVTPGSGSDSNFSVEVYDPATGKVLDKVTITTDPLNNPPVTMPPGSKARVVDPKDSDGVKPKGTATMS
ncbi:MAG: hypothetical protein L6Q99_04460 [Planctomycetes bacterium]|nr:hypothetical protein [Planctomycetota bacterium]